MWKSRFQFKMIETSTIWEIMIKLIPGNSGEFRGTPENSGEIPRRFRGDSEEIPGDSEEFRGTPGNSDESKKIENVKKSCSQVQEIRI